MICEYNRSLLLCTAFVPLSKWHDYPSCFELIGLLSDITRKGDFFNIKYPCGVVEMIKCEFG